MKYYKNTELAKLYSVSEKSIRNWVLAAKEGRLDLQTYDHKGKSYIANTSKNTFMVEQLAAKGKKFKNTRAIRHVTPLPEFYELCSVPQLLDLISNIDVNREIPHQYSYLDGGAQHWDQYVMKLLQEKLPNSLTNTIQLLDLNKHYIDALGSKFKGINVIDLGLGNCIPVKGLLQHLLDQGTLRRYVGIDTSLDMLKIAEQNIATWFGDKVNFESHFRDINYDRFKDLLVADTFNNGSNSVLNIVLFLGGTISNMRDPGQALRTISNSMGKNDVFILTRKLDTPVSRRFFDFAIAMEDPELSIQEKNTLDLLGIEESCYTVEQFFDEEEMARKIQIRLKLDLSITFRLGDKERVVTINKGESLLLWRSSHQTMQDTIAEINGNGFEVIQATKSIDEQYLIIFAKIKQARPLTK